jgi:hypothetical protein
MTNKYPRLRTHVRKGANGQVWVSYYFDNRPNKDIPLGTDYVKAVEQWDKIPNRSPCLETRMYRASPPCGTGKCETASALRD